MKTFVGFIIIFLAMICCPISMKAQDVYISIPVNNIFSRTEFSTVKNVLNTKTHRNWRAFPARDPKIWAVNRDYFSHTSLSGISLPTSVLHWQLASIGGRPPVFYSGDVLPPFKWFNTSEQTWYEPVFSTQGHGGGDVAFNFKVPAERFLNNAFIAGEYSLAVTHNYGSHWLYVIEFSPDSFNTILTIPAAISWISNTPTKYIEVTSLNEYRSSSAHLLGDLGPAILGNTVSLNLHAKASSSSIQFTSSKGVAGTRDISFLNLGSNSPKLNTLPLTSAWQNYSSPSFGVETGNRNNFTLNLSISSSDFKNHFYGAGTYTFQLNLDGKSIDNTISAPQNIEVTMKVLPLSEITIPALGQTVNFEFNTATHYQQGQSKVIPNQILLSNNETFELYVKSDANFFKKAGVQTDINSNILEVGIDGSTSVPLSTTPQKIISDGNPVLDQELDIQYTIPANAAQSLIEKAKTAYSINVIYSFTAL